MNNRTRFALALLLSSAWLGVAGPRGVAAQPAPLGPEVRVDTLAGDQFPNDPMLSVQRDGTFEVAWDYGGSQPASIFARHFTAAVRPTDAAQVLLGSEGFWPQLDAITKAGKGYDVLWHINDDTGTMPPAFYTRHLDARGALLGNKPLKVGKPYFPYVWFVAGDGLVAGSFQEPIRTFNLRKLSPNGVPTLVERRIDTRPIDDPRPSVTPLANGNFVAVFEATSLPVESARRVLRARLFSGTFEPQTPDFDVNTTPAGLSGTAPFLGPDFTVAAAPNGGFAVAWTLDHTLYLRFFNAAGDPLGPEVPAVTSDGAFAPLSAAIDKKGNLLLLWFRIPAPLQTDLQIQLFDSHGAPLGPPEGVNSAASDRYQQPFAGSVAWTGSAWLVTWAAQVGDLEPSAIFVRRFAGN